MMQSACAMRSLQAKRDSCCKRITALFSDISAMFSSRQRIACVGHKVFISPLEVPEKNNFKYLRCRHELPYRSSDTDRNRRSRHSCLNIIVAAPGIHRQGENRVVGFPWSEESVQRSTSSVGGTVGEWRSFVAWCLILRGKVLAQQRRRLELTYGHGRRRVLIDGVRLVWYLLFGVCLSVCRYASRREGKKGLNSLAIKMKARAVVGGEQESLPCDPGSELLGLLTCLYVGGREKRGGEDDKRDGMEKKKQKLVGRKDEEYHHPGREYKNRWGIDIDNKGPYIFVQSGIPYYSSSSSAPNLDSSERAKKGRLSGGGVLILTVLPGMLSTTTTTTTVGSSAAPCCNIYVRTVIQQNISYKKLTHCYVQQVCLPANVYARYNYLHAACTKQLLPGVVLV